MSGTTLRGSFVAARYSSAKFIEAEPFGAGQLNHAVDRSTERDVSKRSGDVVGSDGLKQGG